MSFAITLSDGSKVEGLELNGNNFISKAEISKNTFTGKLSKVTITGDSEKDEAGLIGEHANMELVRCEYDKELGGWAVVLRELSAAELREKEVNARLDFIEIMEDLQ